MCVHVKAIAEWEEGASKRPEEQEVKKSTAGAMLGREDSTDRMCSDRQGVQTRRRAATEQDLFLSMKQGWSHLPSSPQRLPIIGD